MDRVRGEGRVGIRSHMFVSFYFWYVLQLALPSICCLVLFAHNGGIVVLLIVISVSAGNFMCGIARESLCLYTEKSDWVQ